ncbi:MAG: hypothetical protein KF770_13410 [Anaerolineae bacterium]|nr:hypothetical protein [Anaerolineae bacterium]
MSNITKWILGIFGALVIVLNAAETALFGATYLPAAFGNPSNGMSALLAAAYCLLMLDVAYLVWFKVWLSGEQATAQRDMAISLAVVALIGSIMATVTQLATNTGLAAFLVPYRDTIGTIAFFVVVGVTVAHIVGLAVYKYKEPEQQIANKTAKIQGDVIDSALKELETRANADKDILVDILAREFRVDMLNALGFSQELKRVGKQVPALPAPTQDTAVPAQDDYEDSDGDPVTATYDDLQALVDDLVRERLAQERAAGHTAVQGITADDVAGRAFHRGHDELYRLAARLLLGGATQNDAFRQIKQHPAAFREIDTTLLSIVDDAAGVIDQLRKERESDERVKQALEAVPASPNGHGANFTNRPGGRTL